MASDNLQDQINRLKKNVSDTYGVLETAGATLPQDKNSDNLDDTAKTVFTGLQALDLSTEQVIEVDLDEYDIIEIADEGVHIQQTKTITNNGTYAADDGYNVIKTVEVNVPGVKNQNKTVITNGKVMPDEGYTGLGEVTVNVNTVKNQNKTVTANGTYTADTGYTGLGTIMVNVPNSGGSESSIVIPGKIVEGIWSSISFDYVLPSTVTSLNTGFLDYAFYKRNNIKSADLSSVMRATADKYIFAESSLQSLNMSGLKNTSLYGLSGLCYKCKSLTTVDLSALEVIGTLSNTFAYCTSLAAIDLGKLKSGTLDYTFSNCTSLTEVNLSNFRGRLSNTFEKCTSLTNLSFPAYTSAETASRNFLAGVTGCTVHLPSNLEATWGESIGVQAGFGGTNTVILFDLPATT